MLAIEGFRAHRQYERPFACLPYSFQRPGEIRHMEWSEIDWEEERWEIPAEKMKMEQPHIVPLSTQALEYSGASLTDRTRKIRFPQRQRCKPLSI